MKKIVTLIAFMILVNTGYAQFGLFRPKAKPTPSPSPTPVAVEKSERPIQDAKKIIQDLKLELNAVKSENEKLKNNLTNANSSVKKGMDDVVKLNKDIEALKQWGIIKQAEALRWLERYNKAVKRYHKLKWIAVIIAAAGGVIVGLKFMALAPPPYNILIPIGSAGIFGTLIWIFL
jgi:hypothetical protein